MAEAGALVAETIAHVGEQIEPGITTASSTGSPTSFIRSHGGVPTSMGYKGYPAAICISPNAVVVHGIPGAYRGAGGRRDHDRRRRDARRLHRRQRVHVRRRRGRRRRRSGCSTSARRRSPPASRRRSSETASATSRHAVQQVVEGAGFSVVRSLVGHGVGRYYHEDPHIPNFGLPGPRAAALGRDDDRDRADDHGRRARGLRPRGRLDDLDRGRLDRGAFRAHRRDHAPTGRGS